MKRRFEQGSLPLALRIRGAGIPIHIDEVDEEAPRNPPSGVLVYPTGGAIESRAFDLSGAAGFIIRVCITINLPRFAIAQFELKLPWKTHVTWLTDPREMDGGSNVYRFHGPQFLDFERKDVLNHFADICRIWSPGESLKGFLLGIGDEPVQDQYLQDGMIPAVLTIYDQFWRKYESSILLWRERTHPPARLAQSKTRPRRNLLAHRDPIPRR